MQKRKNDPFWATKSLTEWDIYLIENDIFEDLYFD